MLRIWKYILFFFSLTCIHSTFAHGSMEVPVSRLYNCFLEGAENPKSAACKAAKAASGSSQFLYDWNGLNQGAANDNHKALIKDGQLCSASKPIYSGLDLARSDWVTTTITPDVNNQFQFVFYATAPHATKYFKMYLTKPSYDFSTPLKWSDLEDQPFCTITSVSLVNNRYTMKCPFPAGTGKRIIYTIWQRSDSAEAFYACNDVSLNSSTPPTPASWKELATIYAQNPVAVNSKIKFRLFKNGMEAVTTTITIAAGQTLATQWPYYLAQAVNSQSMLANIGQLNAQGSIAPMQSTVLNKIYVKDTSITAYSYGIDIIPPSGGVDFIYPDGIGSYVAGTIVVGKDTNRYKCKPWPASGWCNGSQAYYAPGTGLAWQQAWDLVSK